MKQITQKLKVGKIEITDVPVPVVGPGEVLVRNIYSCISPGTESSTVHAARKGYIGKAKERPEQVSVMISGRIVNGFHHHPYHLSLLCLRLRTPPRSPGRTDRRHAAL